MNVTNQLKEIERVNGAFNEFAEREGVPVAVASKINTCFDELLNNIISYGYDGDEEHRVEIYVKLSDDTLIVSVTDDGRPFNPFDERSPDVTLSVAERPIGGLGVHLVRNVLDRVSYRREGNKNVVRLEKSIAPAEESKSP